MARPPRIEFPGAVYYISARCEAGQQAFADDLDRQGLIDLMAQAMHRFDAQVLAYSLLQDHYHLLLYTRAANLSRLMRHLNGVYTQHHNRRHGGNGELFHGRFKALVVDRDRYLLDACRYVELNPLRMGLVKAVEAWPWSSYRAHIGLEAAPDWLDTEGLWRYVAGQALNSAADRRRAAQRYAKLVAAEPDLQLWPGQVQRQIFLGDAAFARRMLAQHAAAVPTARPAPLGSRTKAKANRLDWAHWLRGSASREQALYRAHTEGGYAMTALAQQLDLSVSRISRLVALYERAMKAGST
ncbi:transposase [Paucibacter sp. Y2R2-4]|uniref:transposase n=1 Tax=Paucibacter sp. Y2R2-4 TaxID=2893553 RepID=UPI0021E3D370|nr:transposase [Paucibacter sp. Y2R2-4]MCV2352492.1 transposase [Paucibacter sp. Y2R2-4]